MSLLSSQSYVFDPRPNYPLVSTVKRYWDPKSLHVNDDNSLTLFFAHGAGFHKEQWEPTIDDLYTLLEDKPGSIKIREIWSIDAPNHGDAAVLNEKELKCGYEPIFGWQEYARCIHGVLTGLGTGIDVDLSQRRLVGIGHSMGTICLMLAHTYEPKLHFESLVLCELMTMAQKFLRAGSSRLARGSVKRRDIWQSRNEAYTVLKERNHWKVWDDRVLRIFVEDGMRPLPTAEYPDRHEGVTLKCTRAQETACYQDFLGASRGYNFLGHVVKKVPTHLLYGAIDDNLPAAVKDDVINVAAGGPSNFASIARVPNAGHLVVQVNPKGLAQAIYNALLIPPRNPIQQAKL